MIITPPDVAEELAQKNLPYKLIGIGNIVDKNEIKTKLEAVLADLG